jgi:hypothetical protein
VSRAGAGAQQRQRAQAHHAGSPSQRRQQRYACDPLHTRCIGSPNHSMSRNRLYGQALPRHDWRSQVDGVASATAPPPRVAPAG